MSKSIFGPSSNVKLGFRMSKCDIRSKFECQNRILNVNIRYLARIRMSKCDIRSKFECQNRILNVKMRYSVHVRMSKYDFECQNSIFGLSSYVKIGFRMSKCDIRPEFDCRKTQSKLTFARIRMSK